MEMEWKWKCPISVLNIVVSYVEPKLLVSLFLSCGLDLNTKFMYDGFYYNIDINSIRRMFEAFPSVVLVGLCIGYSYEKIRCCNDGYMSDSYVKAIVNLEPLNVNYLLKVLGPVMCDLRHLKIVNASWLMYNKLFDSNMLMLFPNIRTLVLNGLELRGLNGMVFCRRLRRIEVDRCMWGKTSIKCFVNLLELRYVKLLGCNVTTSDARALVKCGNLRSLEIHNTWSKLVPFVFGNLVRLRIWNYNGIGVELFRPKMISLEDFNGCRRLRSLDLSACGSVVNLGGDTSYSLRRLRLKKCELVNGNSLCKLLHLRRWNFEDCVSDVPLWHWVGRRRRWRWKCRNKN